MRPGTTRKERILETDRPGTIFRNRASRNNQERILETDGKINHLTVSQEHERKREKDKDISGLGSPNRLNAP